MTMKPREEPIRAPRWVAARWVAAAIAMLWLTVAVVRAQEGPRPGGGPSGPQTPYIMPPIGQAVMSDPHNKLIHFPIVLGLTAAVMVLISRRKPQYEPVAFWLVWFALLSTLAAYFSGFYQSTEFMHRPKRWIMETHERFAIGLAMAECVWILALLRRSTRGLATMMSFVVVALILVTGFLGGLVAHGRGAAPPSSTTRAAAP
jgi:uncharacterized membrane protein